MFAGILGGLAATGVRDHERYLLEDDRYLVAGTMARDSLREEFDALRDFARAQGKRNALARGVVSWHDNEEISIRGALTVARDVIAESPFGGNPAVLVVHGPPIEPTRRHVHVLFALETSGGVLRLTEARRELWAAARRAANSHGFQLPEREGPTPFALRISRAARYWQTTPLLEEWLTREIAPQVKASVESAASWDDVHVAFAPFGLRYVGTPRGGGALHDDSRGVAVRASAIDLAWSRSALEARLGPLYEREPIADAALLKTSYRHAAATADDGEIERHRASRAAWDELYGERVASERHLANDVYAKASAHIRATTLTMRSALHELRPPAEERREITKVINAYRKAADAEALQAYSERLQRAYAAVPRKPSRKLREWQKDRFTRTDPPARLRAIDSRTPALPASPWRAEPTLDGTGLDLYLGRDRLASDYGDRINILDPNIPDEALAALALPQRFRVEGVLAVRDRVRAVGARRALDVRDGGELPNEADPLHAALPDNVLARRCLALMDALRVRPHIDGVPYRATNAVAANAREIELRAPELVMLTGPRSDLAAFVSQVQPQVEGDDVAIYRCADLESANELRARAARANLRQIDRLHADTTMRFAEVARYHYVPATTPTEYRAIAETLQHGVDVSDRTITRPKQATQERPRTKHRRR